MKAKVAARIPLTFDGIHTNVSLFVPEGSSKR